MPTFNVTIDDASPFIVFNGTWSDSSHDDALYGSYLHSTFHATQTSDSAAIFTFNGTGVFLYGAKRSNHGLYTVSVDGHFTTANGSSPDIDNFQTLLYGTTDLTYGTHEVVLLNSGAPSYLDLDYIVVVSGDGNTTTPLTQSTLDDTTPAFVYSSGWSTGTIGNLSQYSSSTAHRTTASNANAEIHFTGNAISIYGATDVDHGMYSVSLDGASPLILNGTAPTFRPQALLCYFDGLSSGSHTLSVTNLGSGSASALDLDYATVSSYSSPGTPSSTTGAGTTNAPHAPGDPHPGLSNPVIAGIAVGVIVVVALLAFAAFYVLRQRARRRGPRPRRLDDGVIDMGKLSGLPASQLVVNAFDSRPAVGAAGSAPPVPAALAHTGEPDAAPPSYDLAASGSSSSEHESSIYARPLLDRKGRPNPGSA